MIEAPLVSVLIPAYNCEKLVARAINSALNQTWNNIECIIVDDGSTDNTAAEINKFKNKVRYIFQDNGGASSARNRAIQEAKGEYIAFLDADDYWVASKLESQIKVFQENPDVALVNTSSALHTENSSLEKNLETTLNYDESNVHIFEDFSLLFKNPYLLTSSVMIKVSIFKEVDAFDESLKTSEDIDLYLRLCWKRNFAKISQVLVYKGVVEGSLGSQLRSYPDNLFVINDFVKKHPEFKNNNIELIKSVKSYIYLNWIQELLYYGQGKEARRILDKSLKVDRLKSFNSLRLKSYICFFLSRTRQLKEAFQ